MTNSSNSTVFFSRCRPQDADPVDLAVRERRVFIGWPAWREDVEPRAGHLREAIIDLRCSDEDWEAHYATFDKKLRKHYQQNRNFVQAIAPGAIALIPRPDRGVVYAGCVESRFELLDDPPWGNEYLDLRREQRLPVENELSHLADVAHCCSVERFAAIPFPLIPAWIRRSLLGRSTYGQIWPREELALEPYPILARLLESPQRLVPDWTTDVAEVERRLVDGVGPNTFEHLCVALLQLEEPANIWMHVGGSGDGGVDGVGASGDGRVIGLLQCKWAYWGENIPLLTREAPSGTRRLFASLLHPPDVSFDEEVEVWSRRDIAALVVKHASRLPIALTLRIQAGNK